MAAVSLLQVWICFWSICDCPKNTFCMSYP